MRRFFVGIWLLCCFVSLLGVEDRPIFQTRLTPTTYGTVKVMCVCIDADAWLQQAARVVAKDLAFTDQIEPALCASKKSLDTQAYAQLFQQGTPLCVSLKRDKKNNIEVTLVDTSSRKQLHRMLVPSNFNDYAFDGHRMADALLKNIVGESCALSRLAYCKSIASDRKVVCVADYLCHTEHVVSSAKTINVAPAWHPKLPIIFYTQFTEINNRLLSFDLRSHKTQSVVSFRGSNMQPTFSEIGDKFVLCLSASGNSELYEYDYEKSHASNRRIFHQLTSNKGNNNSPCLLPDGSVVFCSDFETSSPQIYRYDAQTKQTHRLTTEGYCVGPAYSAKRNMLAYTRPMNGTLQIFGLHLDAEGNVTKNEQLTFNGGDKIDPTWSPCGRYLAFSYRYLDHEQKRRCQIAALNMISGKIRLLTYGDEEKNYPAWGNFDV